MERVNVLVTAVCILSIGLFTGTFVNSAPFNNTGTGLSVKHMKVYDEWLEAGFYVAQNGEVEAIMLETVIDSARITNVSKLENDFPNFEIIKPQAGAGVVVVSILEEDKDMPGAWGDYLRAKEGIHLWTLQSKDVLIIFLRSDAPYSKISKGIIFLDVCFQVWIHNQTNARGDEVVVVSYAEQKQLSLENIIHPTLRRVGGPLYWQVLKDAKIAYGENMDEWFKNIEEYRDALDIIFGETLSPEEDRMRSTLFLTQVIFQYFRENYPEEFPEIAVKKMYEYLATDE